MNYVYRNTSDSSYTFRILSGTPDEFTKTFSDSRFSGKRACKKAADTFADKKLNSLPLRLKRRLVVFGYEFKNKPVIRKRYRVIDGKKTHVGYITKYSNRFKQTEPQKEFSFGPFRTKSQAYKLSREWWFEQIKALK